MVISETVMKVLSAHIYTYTQKYNNIPFYSRYVQKMSNKNMTVVIIL